MSKGFKGFLVVLLVVLVAACGPAPATPTPRPTPTPRATPTPMPPIPSSVPSDIQEYLVQMEKEITTFTLLINSVASYEYPYGNTQDDQTLVEMRERLYSTTVPKGWLYFHALFKVAVDDVITGWYIARGDRSALGQAAADDWVRVGLEHYREAMTEWNKAMSSYGSLRRR